jgi:hypothetical protein
MDEDRAAGRTPTLERMKEEWTRQKHNGDPFFITQKGVSYGIHNLALRWQQLLDYEKQGAVEGGDSADAHNDDDVLNQRHCIFYIQRQMFENNRLCCARAVCICFFWRRAACMHLFFLGWSSSLVVGSLVV